MSKEFVEIGFSQKPHGVKGEIKVEIEEAFIDDLEYLETLFLNVKGESIPYFIEEVRGADWNIIKFEDVDNREQAQVISNTSISVRKTDLQRSATELEQLELSDFSHCENYRMIDVTDGEVGVIEEVVEYPHQEMAVLNVKNREVLIPLTKGIVKQLDDELKTIVVDLPEGLLEL